MCDRRDSSKAVGDAADALTSACLRMCSDALGRALRDGFQVIVSEGIKPEERDLLDKLQ